MSMFKGIDVSRWQENIDFNKVKASGIDFVIIKAGGSDKGFYTDRWFNANYEKAKAAGLNVGAYYFVGKNFLTKEDGIADAKRFIRILEGKQFEYPVYVDVETGSFHVRKRFTDATIGFCETMEDAGYFCGVYASDISGFHDMLENDRLGAYTHWVARYGSKPTFVSQADIWQHSSKGVVDGILKYVDLDISFVDFPKIIKSKGFNGYKKPRKVKETAK